MAATLLASSNDFDSLLRGISGQYSKLEGRNVVQLTKQKLGGDFESIGENDVYSVLKILHKQGQIWESETHLLDEFYAEKTEKKQTIKAMISKYNTTAPKKQDELVGREKDLKAIDRLLKNKYTRAVNLFGDSGVGKTTLANAEGKIFCQTGGFEQKNVDLRALNNNETVISAFSDCLKLPLFADLNTKRSMIIAHFQELTKPLLLVIDNVEQLLQKATDTEKENRSEFISLISDIMNSPAAKKGDMKLLLTSRSKFLEPTLKGFSEVPVKVWERGVSTGFIADKGRLSQEEKENEQNAIQEIAEKCKNNPYLLQGFSQMMREGHLTPTQQLHKVEEQLSDPDIPDQFACMNVIFESLPSIHLKEVAIKVALFQRQFPVSAAMKVANLATLSDANFDLEILAGHKLLSVIDSDDKTVERMYDIHAIFHEFVDIVISNSPKYLNAYKAGEVLFFQHFTEKLMHLSELLETDFVKAYTELGIDQANYDLVMAIASQKESMGFLLYSEEYHKSALISMVFEALKDEKERRALYRNWADLAEKEGKWLSCAQLRCWESLPEADLVGPEEGLNVLKKAKHCLDQAKLLGSAPEKYRAVEGLYLQCHGRMKWMRGEMIPDPEECKKIQGTSMKELEQSLVIRREQLGDHTLTARTLNLMGNSYMAMDEPNKGLKCYEEAMAMKRRLVGSDKHWEMPTYYNQMAAVYERFGAIEEEKYEKSTFKMFKSRKKMTEYYTKAKEWIVKAIALQKELGVSETEHTATFQRNLANILVALGDYDAALESAKESCKRRQEQLGTHPETARILYLIGIIHEWRRDKREALEAYRQAFDVEEALAEDNHSVVRYAIRERLLKMCKYLKETKLLGEYESRIQQIKEHEGSEGDVDEELQKLMAGVSVGEDESIDEQDEEDEPFSTTIRVDATGTTYTKYGVHLVFPPNTVAEMTDIELVIPSAKSVTSLLISDEILISNVVNLGPSSVELKEPVALYLCHASFAKNPGYEVTTKELNTETGWADNKELIISDTRTLKDAYSTYKVPPPLSVPYLQLELWQLTILAVVIRPITITFTVTPRGGRFGSLSDVEVEFPEGAVKKKFDMNMRVQPIPASIPRSNDFIPCPLITIHGFEELEQLNKPVTIRLPHPSPEKRSEGKILLLSEGRDGKWLDLSEELVSVERIGSVLEIKVLHFSRLWPWILVEGTASLLCRMASDVCYHLSRGPELSAYFAAFKERGVTGTQLPDPFIMKLKCILATEEEKLMDKMEGRGYHLLGENTCEMRRLEKAYPQLSGGLEEVSEEGDEDCRPHTFRGEAGICDTQTLYARTASRNEQGSLTYLKYYSRPPDQRDVRESAFLCRLPINLRDATNQDHAVEYYGILFEEIIKQDLPQEIYVFVIEFLDHDTYERFYDYSKSWAKRGVIKFLAELPRHKEGEVAENCFNSITNAILNRDQYSYARNLARLLIRGREIVLTPLMNGEAPLTMERSLMDVAQSLKIDWKQLARYLQVNEARITNCADEHRHESSTEQCYQMLIGWVQSNGREATLEWLLDALRHYRCVSSVRNLAERITATAKRDVGKR